MSETAFDIISIAYIVKAEFRHGIITLGALLLVIFISWFVQEFRCRNSIAPLGWVGVTCLGLVGFGAVALLVIGLL